MPTWNAHQYLKFADERIRPCKDLVSRIGIADPRRIVDLGCGPGNSATVLAERWPNADIAGVDNSSAMIDVARREQAGRNWIASDIWDWTRTEQTRFDLVFSNAALHWVRDQEGAITAIARALKPGGRLVFEMGGRGNIQQIWNAAKQALSDMGVKDPEKLSPWFYPSIGEYATMLESRGLAVTFAVLFDRPTPLEGGERGLRNWLEMFGMFASNVLGPEQREELIWRVEALARPALYNDGEWTVDYRRLRMIAVKL